MNDFDYDVLQKKRIASGARYKKNGCKSRKCSLSQDRMSAAELKRRNGTMHTYQLGAPMSWKEFKALPDDLKRTYILNLREKFNTNAEKLGEMMGVRGATVRRVCIDLGLSEKAHRNMSAAQVIAWEAFWKDGVEETSAELEAPEECEEEEVVIELPKAEEKKNTGCAINSGTVVFKGKAPDIAIALMKFLGDNEYTISVAFSAVAED